MTAREIDRKSWSDGDLYALKKLARQGTPSIMIADRLERPHQAIKEKARKLQLPLHHSSDRFGL
ncbi:hypothetical protein QQM79_07055 [Marinobacteraceae bacterium S3BR75-40.1]